MLYQRYFNDDKISSLALYVDDAQASDVGAFTQDLRTQFAGRDLVISANRELRDERAGGVRSHLRHHQAH